MATDFFLDREDGLSYYRRKEVLMKARVILLVLLGSVLSAAFADFNQDIASADRLKKDEAYVREEALLKQVLPAARSDADKAEVLWRLARVTLNLAGDAEKREEPKNSILAMYETGETYADQAIAADPGNFNAYYWKASNMGKWGSLKGILDSLFKAKPMREFLEKTINIKADHPDSYYVLGQLYEKVPGFPVSFGNSDYAVSLGRLSVDLHEKELKSGADDEISYDFYSQLASHLIVRDWDASKRLKEQVKKEKKYRSTRDPLDKGFTYEGSIPIKNISDKDEAKEILTWVISEIGNLGSRSASQEKDLKTAKEMLASL